MSKKRVYNILAKANESIKSDNIFFESKEKCYSFLNPYGYNLMRQNIDLFEKIDVLFFDGILLCHFYNLFYKGKVSRKSFDMTSIAKSLFTYLDDNNKTIYFIGAKQEEVEGAIKRFKEDFPNMNIMGFRNGYFKNDFERSEVINYIISLNPDFVVVGMGAIVQEKFIVDLKEFGFKGVSFTCGGFIHQASENLFFFPDWINKLHLRSFYRLYKEKATRKRFSKTIFNFPINFITDKFFK
ncbi:WecB/TagA/CpsF family glycosyltransferase [Myroides odoratimimus]|uniref:WecB/TagA/CpsF family glycosyltransferase n=1 Tax=Myroides odoratimimus TaxID=76832 RepID=UPI003D2F0819